MYFGKQNNKIVNWKKKNTTLYYVDTWFTSVYVKERQNEFRRVCNLEVLLTEIVHQRIPSVDMVILIGMTSSSDIGKVTCVNQNQILIIYKHNVSSLLPHEISNHDYYNLT